MWNWVKSFFAPKPTKFYNPAWDIKMQEAEDERFRLAIESCASEYFQDCRDEFKWLKKNMPEIVEKLGLTKTKAPLRRIPDSYYVYHKPTAKYLNADVAALIYKRKEELEGAMAELSVLTDSLLRSFRGE